MSEKILNVRFQIASKKESEWQSSNPILKLGELALSTDKLMFKIGDGTSAWASLSYTKAIASDVYSWAKASTKPSYSWSEITSKPSTFTPSSHTHATSDITSGTLNSARLPVVPVSKGGTGLSSLTSGQVLIGNGTSNVGFRAIDTTTGGTSGSTSLITSGAVYAGLAKKSDTHSHPYLPTAGGTMGGTAFISWPDTDNWSNSNSGVTFPVVRGGLQWSGQSDGIKLFAEETANDNLELILQFTDDNSNGLTIRNSSGTKTARIDANGVFTGSFSGNASTATKLQTARTINGTSFDGSGNITTANWGTARNISISDSAGTNTGSAVSVNGSAAVVLKLPATIAATLSGNASTATKATQDSAGQQINTTYIKGLSISGRTITYTKGDGTAGTITTQDTNTTYGVFGAATSSAAGSNGLVPAPAAGKQGQYLRGDGTWSTPTNTTYGVATTSANGLMSASDKSKLDGIAANANNYSHPNSGVTAGTYRSVTVNAQGHVTGGSNPTTLSGYGITDAAAKSHTHGNADITALDAGKITSGVISIDRLPQGALERCVVVADDTARFKLTSSNVQVGDTVKVTGTGKMYFVVDSSKLNAEAGYEVYTAGSATSVPWSGVTGKPSTFTPSSHTHSYAGSSSAGGAANSVANSIAIKLNGGGTEGTNLFTFNGSAGKTVNITPSAIGAAASSHGTHVSYSTDAPKANGTAAAGSSGAVARADHVHPLQTSVSGNAGTASKLQTARTIALSGSVTGSASFDGSGNITISTSTNHSHNYAGSSSAGGAANSANLVNGVYTSNGGAQAPSYISGGTVRFNMMNSFKGLSSLPTYADCILMDTYTGSDVPYVTGLGIVKSSGNPRAFIAVGAKGNTSTWASQTELITAANYNSYAPTKTGGGASGTWGINVSGSSASCTGNAATSTKATQDSAGQQINTTYIKALSVSGKVITYTKGDGTTGTITTQDTNTTYSTGTASALGLTKLYTATGTATDGTMTQKAITDALGGKAASTHTHTKSQITDFPSTLANPNAIVIKLNGGSTEGTNLFTYTGSAAKTINITPSAIGAAASSHGTHVSYSTTAPAANGTASAGSASTVSRSDHVHPLQTSVSGNAGTATKLATARKIGNASFDGSANITLAQMGIINPIELTKAEYNALKANGTLDMTAYYNITDDYDSATVIDDVNVSNKFVFSSSKTESTYAKKSTVVNTTLSASSWSGSSSPYTYVLSVSGVTATNVNEINFSSSATDAQVEAYQNAMLKDGGQSNGKITLKATGDKPTVDIPITIIVRHDV